MTPFPKWTGFLGVLGVAMTTLGPVFQTGAATGDWSGLMLGCAATVSAVGTFLSHSATGTGGKPPETP